MPLISGIAAGAGRPPAAAAEVHQTAPARRAEEEARPLKPARDEYVPEEKQESYGRYWPGRDEDGQPRIYFDDPEAAEAPAHPDLPSGGEEPDSAPPAAGGPEKRGKKEERCVCDTGKVDREIERAKKKKADLEQRISAEHDETRARDLEKQLARADAELRQKDTDAYRRRHAVFTQL